MEVTCTWCGIKFNKKPSKVYRHNFCGRTCFAEYKGRNNLHVVCERCGKAFTKWSCNKSARNFCSRKCNLKMLNEELNPTRMNPATKTKLRYARLGKGMGKTYTKTFGVHTHRIVAMQMLGRELRAGEVVHHIDGNKRNNAAENLMVFCSQAEHVKWHAKNAMKGGGAGEVHST